VIYTDLTSINFNSCIHAASRSDSAICQLCTILQIPEIFSSGSLAHLHSHAHIAILQHHLAEALGHRYNHSYSSVDIDERIGLCRDALLFLNKHSEHISPVSTMACLGAGLYIRFNSSAQQNDLQEGFALLSSAVQTSPSEPNYLADFGSLLIHMYLASGSVDHLDESLAVLHRAHDLRMGHPARGRICRLLAAATGQKDNQCGQRHDFSLEALIEHYKEVLMWQPLGHHSHFEGWDGLAMVFLMQFYRTSNRRFLDRAIHFGQRAYIMLNPRHPRAFRHSNNLSDAFKSRYNALGTVSDLELALSYAKRALDSGPPDRQSMLMRNVANIMAMAAEYSGNIEMLSESISVAREALDCVHESERFMALQTLGLSLIAKASHLGDTEHLKEGIYRMRQLLECVNEATVYYADGAVYASEALIQYYEMDSFQHFQALTEAMNLLERLRGRTIPEVYRARVLHCIAKAYRAQFYHGGLPDMLKSAFNVDQQALDLRPPGHPQRCMSLAALSEDLVELSAVGELIDLGNAIGMLKVALKDLAEGHPDFSKVTISLAKLLLIPDTPYTDPKNAFSSILHMLRDSPGSVYRTVVDMIPVLRSVETNLASKWIVDNDPRRQCLDVYQALIDILPRLASLDLDLSLRIQVLSHTRDLATMASANAVTLQQFSRAVELLESGRAVFWAQHLRLRTSFDSLDDHTAKELRDISRRLELTATSMFPPDLDSNLAQARIERIMADRRRLNARFDDLIDQVRLQPGMNNFLRNLDYTALSSAASHGPVVILQHSWMCVITVPYTDPHVVPLHQVTSEWLQGAASTLRLAASKSRNRLDDRGAKTRLVDGATYRTSDEYETLADIWRRIMQPLLGFLGWEVS
jgi:tetratricopeptide (TPR) repeat protein